MRWSLPYNAAVTAPVVPPITTGEARGFRALAVRVAATRTARRATIIVDLPRRRVHCSTRSEGGLRAMRRSGWRLCLLRALHRLCSSRVLRDAAFCTAHSCWAIHGLLLTRRACSNGCEARQCTRFLQQAGASQSQRAKEAPLFTAARHPRVELSAACVAQDSSRQLKRQRAFRPPGRV